MGCSEDSLIECTRYLESLLKKGDVSRCVEMVLYSIKISMAVIQLITHMSCPYRFFSFNGFANIITPCHEKKLQR